jgi:hypothetical protein
MNTMGGDKRQGGSTITQQVAKNLLVGDSITYERKIREVIAATRLEKAISKQEILEIYLNSIYLGRSSWGVDLAAQRLFRQAVPGADAGRRRLPRRADPRAGLLQSRTATRPRPRAPRLRADPHEGRRHHHRGAGHRSRGRAR